MVASAGSRSFSLFDEPSGRTIPLLVMYPSDSRPATDGAIAPGTFPLVVISHGNGGSGALYRSIATHLARNGFVVALPDHAGNTRGDNDLARTVANLESRPRHIRLTIDWAYGASPFAPFLKAGAVAIIGHSLGGYTALAIAGGLPAAFAHETPDRVPRPVEVMPDERVKALVLLAPATAWFKAGDALRRVRVPILMMTAEHDASTPAFHGDIVKDGIPDPALLDHRVIANAGHYSFLDSFPPALTNPSFPPSQDPAGFDRERFHGEMDAEILAFLRRL
jgi:predicted dienelactone hydrolase